MMGWDMIGCRLGSTDIAATNSLTLAQLFRDRSLRSRYVSPKAQWMEKSEAKPPRIDWGGT
jgi:hypothetical protein